MKIIISEQQLNNVINTELGEKSRSFAFTRKKRLFPKVAKKYNPNRFREYEREVDEVKVKEKSPLGSGIQHKVYESKRYPDKVFKVGLLDSVQDAYQFFKNYPYLFPKVYGYKKLGEMKDDFGNDLYYIILEKLDTKSFVTLWRKLAPICKNVIGESFYMLVYDLMYKETEWIEFLDHLKDNEKDVYEKALELYQLVYEINEIYDGPDIHDGQFGYDKEGVLKCLDF
jgi:hypothetical protein